MKYTIQQRARIETMFDDEVETYKAVMRAGLLSYASGRVAFQASVEKHLAFLRNKKERLNNCIIVRDLDAAQRLVDLTLYDEHMFRVWHDVHSLKGVFEERDCRDRLEYESRFPGRRVEWKEIEQAAIKEREAGFDRHVALLAQNISTNSTPRDENGVLDHDMFFDDSIVDTNIVLKQLDEFTDEQNRIDAYHWLLRMRIVEDTERRRCATHAKRTRIRKKRVSGFATALAARTASILLAAEEKRDAKEKRRWDRFEQSMIGYTTPVSDSESDSDSDDEDDDDDDDVWCGVLERNVGEHTGYELASRQLKKERAIFLATH